MGVLYFSDCNKDRRATADTSAMIMIGQWLRVLTLAQLKSYATVCTTAMLCQARAFESIGGEF
jgi:hypothetical protein